MDRNLALEFVRVTEAASIAASAWIGRGDKNSADGAAVDEMRDRFNQIDFNGTVVIGEGTKDEAPELYTGEKVGTGNGPAFDLAVDPLECTDSVAFGRYNAMSVIVAGSQGSLMNAPDMYMEQIAVGPKAAGVIDLESSITTNIEKVAFALGKQVSDLVVAILDRDRHESVIQEIRNTGARIRLITDGTVAVGIATALPSSGIDMLVGTGGSTEAVLLAAGIKILGGACLARFWPRNDKDLSSLSQYGILDAKKIYNTEDLAKGNQLTFTATGIIDGPLLPGIVVKDNIITTHSVVMRAQSGTVRYVATHHKSKNSKSQTPNNK